MLTCLQFVFRIPTLGILLCRPIMFDGVTTVLMFPHSFLLYLYYNCPPLPLINVMPNLNTTVIDLTVSQRAPLTSTNQG
jgi:hypothetical protein